MTDTPPTATPLGRAASRGRMASVEGSTLADLDSLLRYFRSMGGPLCAEVECGSLTLVDDDRVISFRALLRILDGPESGLQRIDIYGTARTVKEVRALFSAYRRLRRATRRLEQHTRQVQHGQTDGCHAQEHG